MMGKKCHVFFGNQAYGAKVIQLDQAGVDNALPRISSGLRKYCWLQSAFKETDVAQNREFQTRFNGFYRVRRNADWQREFYNILQNEKSQPSAFAAVLRAIQRATGRIEASFASKLVATIDPDKPVIDSIVLKNLGFRLPTYGDVFARTTRIVELYDRLTRVFLDYLRTEIGLYLTKRFDESYPNLELTGVKKPDLVLWQTRSSPESDDAVR
jgi:hypothetical protein